MVCVAVGGRCCHCGKEEVKEVNIHICTHTLASKEHMDSCTVRYKYNKHTHTHAHTEIPPTYRMTTNLVRICEEQGRGTKRVNELVRVEGRRSET